VRYPWRRIAAWLVDWACILGWVAVTAAVGVPLYLAGIISPAGTVALNVVGAIVIVLPVVIALALFESSRRAATPGKRVLGLRVCAHDARPAFLRALGRNALKIGLPWLIGHAAVFALVTQNAPGRMPAWVWIYPALAYVIPIAWIVSLFLPSGRTAYDIVTRTTVELTPSGQATLADSSASS
jgi:uncharacterized RDD family membrane protein YckC